MDFPHLTEDDMAEIKKEVSIHAVDSVSLCVYNSADLKKKMN